VSVDRWLRERTYGPQAFDPDVLRDVKRADGRRVSVVLPTLQVEQTVGPICRAIAEAWMDGDAPLVDELVVIDGASTDGTDEAARAAGARVVQEHDVLPQVPGRGKGAAMWRSLAVTTGEVMAFLDADVVDFDPEFVPQLIGPLFTDPATAYVKGFFDRPLADTTIGGGRVSEICARPLINRFRPELAGFMQPLSGEAAGRRDVFESVPFFSGYAVEIGLLWDIATHFGIDAMAQVDLGHRIHSNQPTAELGSMAAAILAAVLRREGRDDGSPIAYDRPRVGTDGIHLHHATIDLVELPPVATLTEGARG
jgi:glucosyl-3-phosphoglycerate synthase